HASTFSRYDWDIVHEFVETNVVEAERGAVWEKFFDLWIDDLRRTLGSGFRIRKTRNFTVLSDGHEHVIRVLDSARSYIERVLPGVGISTHTTVLIIPDIDSYYSYVSGFYPERGYFALSGGIFLKTGWPHMVVNACGDIVRDSTILHELVHASLDHLEIPLWL